VDHGLEDLSGSAEYPAPTEHASVCKECGLVSVKFDFYPIVHKIPALFSDGYSRNARDQDIVFAALKRDRFGPDDQCAGVTHREQVHALPRVFARKIPHLVELHSILFMGLPLLRANGRCPAYAPRSRRLQAQKRSLPAATPKAIRL
jgi:hypothetical protein